MLNVVFLCFLLLQLNTEWAQVEVVDLINDGSGLGFGIIGGRSTGVVVKTIVPGGVSDRVTSKIYLIFSFCARVVYVGFTASVVFRPPSRSTQKKVNG